MEEIEQPEASTPQAAEKNPLLEKLGKDKLRWITSVGLFAATALGVSGKPNIGGAAGVEVFSPVTGEPVSVGVNVVTRDEAMATGIPDDMLVRMKDPSESFQVQVGSGSVIVYVTAMEERLRGSDKSLRIFAGIETTDQRRSRADQRSAMAKAVDEARRPVTQPTRSK